MSIETFIFPNIKGKYVSYTDYRFMSRQFEGAEMRTNKLQRQLNVAIYALTSVETSAHDVLKAIEEAE